ncbi:MAG: FAD-dependent monooxygenase, partial [Phycisphaerales bacterium]|nr:FAD-dependent monooxygenase [Phycisphaerales bacterium]
EKRDDPTMEEVQEIIRTRTTTGWTVTAAHWLNTFVVNERQVEQYRHGRMMLAGDAAHVHSPAGGQGMNTGIQDALNVAWKLALVMRGGAADSLLDTYQGERHPIGKVVVEDTSRLARIATIQNPLARVARNTMAHLALSIPAVRKRFRDMLTEDNLHYRKGPMADGTGSRGLRSGDALPNELLEIDGQPATLHRLLRHAGAVLLAVGDSVPEGLPARFGDGEAGFPLEVVHVGPGGRVQDSGGRMRKLLGGDGGLVLVRPDGIVATIGHSPEEITNWLERNLPMSRTS